MRVHLLTPISNFSDTLFCGLASMFQSWDVPYFQLTHDPRRKTENIDLDFD